MYPYCMCTNVVVISVRVFADNDKNNKKNGGENNRDNIYKRQNGGEVRFE